MVRLADAVGLTPSELLALVGEGEPLDAISPSLGQERVAEETAAVVNAWDADWIPARQLRKRATVNTGADMAYLASPRMLADRRQAPRGGEVRLLDVLVGSEVMTADADEPIGPVVERMYERAYSQVPVYRGKNLVGLLTNDAVARWLGSSQSRSPRHEKTTVAEVLALAEVGQSFELVGHAASVHQVLAIFDRAMHEGAPISAVLVAQDGVATEKPIGIVTVADLPLLRRFEGRTADS
jgi:predicted transcriptional regulator